MFTLVAVRINDTTIVYTGGMRAIKSKLEEIKKSDYGWRLHDGEGWSEGSDENIWMHINTLNHYGCVHIRVY